MDDGEFRSWLRAALDEYTQRFPAESGPLDRIAVGSCRAPAELDLRDRSRTPFHVTASGVVVRDRRVALVLQRSLGVWLQPGGHLRSREAPWDAARRETEEETGLRATHPIYGAGEPPVLDIDLHEIPANAAKREPAHLHLDVRFLLAAPAGAHASVGTAQSEISEVRWVAIDAMVSPGPEPGPVHVGRSLRRALAKANAALARSDAGRPAGC